MVRNCEHENKKLELGLIILCILILIPIFTISVYNRAVADDYGYSIITHQIVEDGGNFFDIIKGAWDTSVYYYNDWQGLYTSAFLLALQPGIYGEEYYALTTPILLGLIYICLYASIYILNKHFVKRSNVFVASASAVLLTMLVLWLPSPTEGLFWYNGAMNYMPFAFLNVLNVCILLEIYYNKYVFKRNMLLIGSVLLSFLISGGNHVTAFANILFLLIANGLLLVKKRDYALFPLMSAIIGFVIMYIAPGTYNRQSYFEKQPILDTIVETAKYVRGIAGIWFSFSWFLSMLVISPTAIEIVKKNKEKFSKHFPFLPIILSVAVICGMFCVPYLPMGSFGEGRLTNVVWITFMFLSIFNYILILGYFAANDYINFEKIYSGSKKAEFTRFAVSSLGMVMLAVLMSGGQTSTSLRALIELGDGTAEAYCEEMDERIALYTDSELTEVAVAPIQVRSGLLFLYDLGVNPKTWPNRSLSEYYGKDIYVVYGYE